MSETTNRSRKYSNSIVAVNDEKSRKEYVLNNYTRLEEEYNKFKKRYNIYHSAKEILEIIFILLGTLATVIPVILSSVEYLDDTTSHVISSIGAIQTLISVSISKILNGKLIQNIKNKMINRKETRDKIFNFYTKAIEDGEISIVEMMEIRKIIHLNSIEKLNY